MSYQAVKYVLRHSRARGSARLVLVAIAEHADETGGRAWPSTETLAELANVSERMVRKNLRELESLGELTVHYKSGPHGCNLYTISLSAKPAEATTPGTVVPGTTGQDPEPQFREPGTTVPQDPEPQFPQTTLEPSRTTLKKTSSAKSQKKKRPGKRPGKRPAKPSGDPDERPPLEPFPDLSPSLWQRWTDYKRDEHGFRYRSADSERTAVRQLCKLARGQPEHAEAIIEQSIANGWKGLFALKNPPKQKQTNGSPYPRRQRTQAHTPESVEANFRRLIGEPLEE
ncbi:MAG: helix-turn-helix domain-containing protein [Rhodothermales bacterium]|nr:helix-turn-helix domain-containing protein [Rhodothermales bacterium]